MTPSNQVHRARLLTLLETLFECVIVIVIVIAQACLWRVEESVWILKGWISK